MLRVASFNVNGIRAAHRRGFVEWLTERQPDVVALQEVRCADELLPEQPWGHLHGSYDAGELAGRNGVAVLTRDEPTDVRVGIGSREFDGEGRYLEVDLDRPGQPGLTVASVYVPKGGTPFEDEASLAKMERKFRFLNRFARKLTESRRAAARAGREFVVLGDFNIAHHEVDLKNWRANRKNEGFLPEERDWFSSIVGDRTLHDVVRRLHPDENGPYSWWSWRGQAFVNDAGWRIDYHLASPALARTAVTGGTDRPETYEARVSDHAAVVVDYDF